MLASFVNNSISLYLLHLGRNNYVLYNLFSLFEALTLFYYFHLAIVNRFVRKIIIPLAIVFFMLWGLSWRYNGFLSYYDANVIVENSSIILLAVFYYYEQVITINTPFIYKERLFWVTSAYFIYFAGIFFLYIYIPTLSVNEKESYYPLEYIFIIIRSFLLSLAMVIKPEQDNFNTNINVSQKKYY